MPLSSLAGPSLWTYQPGAARAPPNNEKPASRKANASTVGEYDICPPLTQSKPDTPEALTLPSTSPLPPPQEPPQPPPSPQQRTCSARFCPPPTPHRGKCLVPALIVSHSQEPSCSLTQFAISVFSLSGVRVEDGSLDRKHSVSSCTLSFKNISLRTFTLVVTSATGFAFVNKNFAR